MLKEFKEFIARGNLVELAVAVVLGLAFNGVVQSLVADVFTPLIAAIFGQPNFYAITISVGDGQIFIGSFLNAVISFVIVAFVLFLVIKAYNRASRGGVRRTHGDRAAHADTGRAARSLTHFRV